MKEITRIHIAKTPYDIETGAKKTLEAYLKSLEAYSADTEITTDVEIRITEILAERGVQKNGVIAEADVTALKEQLGEPRDFMGDGDMAVGDDALETTDEPGRKLFRDTDRAVLGGVLAGLAAFTKVDVVWVRLIFIIIALASFGTALLVYVVLWLAVPAARTAAERLQMAGRPVTVNSIRELNENEVIRPQSNGRGQRVALALLGAMFSFGALVAAGLTIAALVSFAFANDWQNFNSMEGMNFFKIAFTLGVASGVLLTALMVLSAYASFARKLTKRVAISGGIIIVLGMMSFATGLGLARYGHELNQQQIQENTHESALQLPAGTEKAAALVADAPGLTIDYIVDETRAPRASTELFAYNDQTLPKIDATIKNGVLTIATDKSIEPTCRHVWCMGREQKVTVYGPALDQLTANEATVLNYETGAQRQLTIEVKEDASLTVAGGVVQNVSVEATKNGTVHASDATVKNVTAHVSAAAHLDFGTVTSLDVSDEKSCPSGERTARVGVWDITNGDLTFNGKKQAAKTMDSGCTEIEIEKETTHDRR